MFFTSPVSFAQDARLKLLPEPMPGRRPFKESRLLHDF